MTNNRKLWSSPKLTVVKLTATEYNNGFTCHGSSVPSPTNGCDNWLFALLILLGAGFKNR